MPVETGPSAAVAPAAIRPWSVPWSVRLRDALATYVPLLLMALLAAATWWLVSVTPGPAGPRASGLAPDTPDYILRDFELKRYAPSGELQGLIQGRVLRHYPGDDRLEVDGMRLLSREASGAWTTATARSGQADGAGRWARLQGGAVVEQAGHDGRPTWRVEGEALEAQLEQGRITSSQPVRLIQDGLVVDAAGLDFDRQTERLVLLPPVRSRWQPTPAGRR